MKHRYNRSRHAGAFPPTRPLHTATLLFGLGLVAMLPVSASAQSPLQDDAFLQTEARTAEYILTGSAIGSVDGIRRVGNARLAEVSGKYVAASPAHAIRRDPGVILWDEGSGPAPHTGTRLQSGGSSNQQNNSLTVVGR